MNYPKSPETIQAQVAAYAAESGFGFDVKGDILNNVPHIATGEAVIHFALEPDEAIPSVEGYTQYVRDKGGVKHEAIKGRVDLLMEFSKFAPEVEVLQEEISQLASLSTSPHYLGEGTSAVAFKLAHEGKDYVTLIPRFRGSSGSLIDGRIAGAMRVRGEPHFEQVVAASYDSGITISELIPGKPSTKLTPEEIEAIPSEHLEELLRTLTIAHDKGISIDFIGGSNFIYDPRTGFHVIDFTATDKPISVKDMAGNMVEAFTRMGILSHGMADALMEGTHPELTVEQEREIEAYQHLVRQANRDIQLRFIQLAEKEVGSLV
jgi:hypothetical protein